MDNKTMYGDLNSTIEDKSKYKEFSTEEECKEWGNRYYSNFGNKYKEDMLSAKKVGFHSNSETSAIEHYCGHSYKGINQYLRNGVDSGEEIYYKMASILIMAMCSAPKIPEDIVVYRMVNKVFIDELTNNNKFVELKALQEKGFMSTSLLRDISNIYSSDNTGLYLLKIYVPKGTIGIYVNSVVSRDEEEILIAPNYVLRLVDYPYYDESNSIKIFECQLLG